MNKIYSPLKQLDSSGSSILKYQINSPIKANYTEKKEKNIEFDYGLFNKYKLDDLINLQGDGFDQPKVVRMAFIENSALHLEESCIEIFQKYAKNEIAFAGIYGKAKSGKSLLLDKLINLSEVEGGHFTRGLQRTKGIYLWSIPYSRNNVKIFLIDIDGYDQNEIDEDYVMLLNFYLFVCSTLIILQSLKQDDYQQFNSLTKQIKKCKKYFVSTEQINNDYFPNRLYCLFRNHIPQSKTIQPLKKLFNQFNFSIIGNAMSDTYGNDFKDEDLKGISMKRYNLNKKMLNQTYLKQISALFRDIHTKIQCKHIQRLKFTGANLVKLTVNTVQNINLKGHINIDKIFQRSLKQLYTQAYDYHTQMYNQHLGKYLMDQKPIQMDNLLGIFQESHDLVFRSFDILTIDPQLKRVYGDKLQKYIRQKQKIILAINKKKCNNKNKQAVPHIKQKPQIKQMAQFIEKAKKSPKYMQQVYIKQIAPQIAKGMKQLETKRKMQEENDKEKILKKKIEQEIKAKQNQLVQIQKNYTKKVAVVKQTEKKKEFLELKEKQLSDALRKIKMQTTQLVEGSVKNSIKNPGKTIQQLKQQQMRLQRQSKMREKAIKQLKSQPDLNTQKVQLISSQIDKKIIKQKQLQSALASHIPRLQSIQAFRSSSKISPRKVQSRAFQSDNPNIRVITSTKL